MVIIAMGYSGTGSSSIIHLLSEYENCSDCCLGKYEHLLFYTPGGLFDLEDSILYNNSLHRSDAAINDFYKAMKRLNDNDFGWFGGYKKRFGPRFMEIVNEFIEEIVQYRTDGYWSYDFKLQKNIYSIMKDCLKKLLGRETNHFGYRLLPYGDGKLIYSFVKPETFYKAARKFVNNYFNMLCPQKDKIILLDQIILPQHLCRIDNYFDEDVKCIVFDRDIRDIYILTKYIWPQMYNISAVFPTNPDEFVEFYRDYRGTERFVEKNNILRLHFEDLIYNYEKTVDEIEKFVGLTSEMHIHRYEKFNPNISIKNTQNFRIKTEWILEVENIAKQMSDFVYDFPYIINPTIEETSDP